jgi:hypothetical protein
VSGGGGGLNSKEGGGERGGGGEPADPPPAGYRSRLEVCVLSIKWCPHPPRTFDGRGSSLTVVVTHISRATVVL